MNNQKKICICLDAGHYGRYNRSPVVREYYESEMTWKLHLYLKEELERLGIRVTATRTEQKKNPSLVSRGKSSKGCDLFLSIHSNACGTQSVDRPVVITQLDGRGDALGRKLAEAIRATMQTNDPWRVYHKKGISGEYYGVLRGAAKVGTMGMILERSFHTNARAARWLLVEENLRRMAKAEAQVIAEYFGVEDTTEDKPAAEPEKETVSNKLDFARDYNPGIAGTYHIVSDDGTLNLRAGASVDKPIIEAMPSDSRVRCYGYHTGEWLYVVSEAGEIGFCHGAYLRKE